MRVWKGLFALILGAAALPGSALTGSAALAAPSDADAEATAKRVFAPGEYQTSLPTPDRAVPQAPEWRPPPERSRPARNDADPPPSFEPPRDRTDLSGLGKALFYLVVGVAVLAVLLALGRWLMQPKHDNVRVQGAIVAPEQGPPPPPPLSEHERLALQERFDEAIHVLLLNALAPLRTRYSDALTSREVLARVGLEGAAGDALHGLVRAVELSHFGGVAASREEYENCRKRFATVQAALRPGAAAA